MSDIDTKGEFTTKLRNDTFLQFAERSTMGILIIQRGYLQYFNHKFTEIFGYTVDDILNWNKREFYKIVHPEDLPDLIRRFKVENDKKTVSVRFRGVRKDKKVIPIENYMCYIKYNNKTAFLSSYIPLEEYSNEFYIPELIKTKEEKLIILKFSPNTVKYLEDNNLDFEIIKHSSYREED
ncbi:MAG: PAS domain-containing protein [Candidatus Lokiarchaeota archaeon]|nr:PAS domain-containing protein [Candidatus Lokiarchaeota archaeon]